MTLRKKTRKLQQLRRCFERHENKSVLLNQLNMFTSKGKLWGSKTCCWKNMPFTDSEGLKLSQRNQLNNPECYSHCLDKITDTPARNIHSRCFFRLWLFDYFQWKVQPKPKGQINMLAGLYDYLSHPIKNKIMLAGCRLTLRGPHVADPWLMVISKNLQQ